MNANRWSVVVLISAILLPLGIVAQEPPKMTSNDTENDVCLLKQHVVHLTACLRKVEQRVLQLEEQIAAKPAPTTPTRPLGDGFQVDESGIIWFEGAPVGIWGINGSEIQSNSAAPARR